MTLLQPRTVMITGPVPRAGEQFCALCVMHYKAACLDNGARKAFDDAVAGLNAKTTVHLPDYEVPGQEQPQPAVGTGLVPQLQAMAPLCWGHVTGVKFTSLAVGGNGGGLQRP